ncbi:cyclin-T1-3-like isoform X1 [Cucurbita maxima]|uniref:B-like cyclin n=1 Tax=Cucurbita maxima TaxID=3661 RepID=A0A6J1KZ23_CUCMA|nr:cyclin-T1-3-like isoform X1 [Cucurbita maxima]XP_023006031.1 cyclin-T1-3-like isoform X1 [Cucurbita maxima]
MSRVRNFSSHGGMANDDYWITMNRYDVRNPRQMASRSNYYDYGYSNHFEFSGQYKEPVDRSIYARPDISNYIRPHNSQSFKRRKFSASRWEDSGRYHWQARTYDHGPSIYSNLVHPPPRSNNDVSTSASCKRDRSIMEDDEPSFMSRDEIERCSPSRKDGIDTLRETHLRYTYCAFLQSLGLHLELPQTTIGTAMVLCHRFFVRRSHACHDRFLIATSALFLAAKSEETPRPLNNVLRASSEILHKQDFNLLSYKLPVDWFEQYRERVTEAEQLILTTLNFELNVQHPYAPLMSVLNKIGLSQSMLVNLALNLISEGLRSSLWLQFKPHQIAAGAAYLSAKLLHVDFAPYQNILQEFQATPAILQDVAQQLMELF